MLRVWGAYIWRGLYTKGLIFGILRYFTKETCKSNHIIICSFREWVSWSKYCFLIDYLSFPLGILPQCSRRNVFIDLETQSMRKKKTIKQTRSPKFCIAFLKFLLGITVVARKIEDIAYAHAILFGGGEGRGQTSSIMKHVKMIQSRLAGVRFSVLLGTFSLLVFFFNIFLFLMCPFWSGVGYDFRGNYGSVWTYLWFQFQMSKNEFEMAFKKSFLLLLWSK